MLKVIITNSLWPQQALFVCFSVCEQFNIQDASVTVLDKCTQALIVSQHKEANGQQTDWRGQEGSLLIPPDVWTGLSPADGAHWTVLSRLHPDSSVP